VEAEPDVNDAPIACVARYGSWVAASAGSHFVVYDMSGAVVFRSGSEGAHTATIRCMKFSPGGTFLATGADDKLVKLWSTDGAEWQCYRTAELAKKVTGVDITADATTVVASDKFGDVVSVCAAQGASEEPKYLCGHMSLVTTLTLAAGDSFVVTADRDEHIRVSNFPDAFDIHRILLGHKVFVTALAAPPTLPDLLVSGDGKGQLRVWRLSDGTQVGHFEVPQEDKALQASAVVALAVCSKSGLVAALCEGVRSAFMFSLNAEGVLDCAHVVPLARPSTSLCFDDDGCLWLASNALRAEDRSTMPFVEMVARSGEGYAVAECASSAALQAGAADEEAPVGSVLGRGVTSGHELCHAEPAKRPKHNHELKERRKDMGVI